MTDDREPQPTDGPDYHAEHAAWRGRHAETENRTWVVERQWLVQARTANDALEATIQGVDHDFVRVYEAPPRMLDVPREYDPGTESPPAEEDRVIRPQVQCFCARGGSTGGMYPGPDSHGHLWRPDLGCPPLSVPTW